MLDFAAAEGRLDELMMFGIKLGLEQVRELLERVGSPDRSLRFIHLAGSNGKGSVGAMLEAALRRTGYRTGFFSSPHLISVCERFRIDGRAIGREEFAALMEEMLPAIDAMRAAGHCPTYFEVNTVMAALYFARHQVDWVIWETGMGGRLDATNAVTPEITAITGISLEHQQYLGNTIAAIAGEKAGIVKPGIPIFTADLVPDAAAVTAARAAEVGAPLHLLPQAYLMPRDPIFHAEDFTQEFSLGHHRLRLRLAGTIQQRNAALALNILEYLAKVYHFELKTALAGMAEAFWPGRMQRLPGGIILDGAHNPEGAAILAATLQNYFPGRRFSVIFGSLADKDTDAVLRELLPVAADFVLVPIDSPRPSRSPEELQQIVAEVAPGLPCRTAANVAAAMATITPATCLIAGSLYLAGEVLNLLIPEEQTLNLV